MLALSGMRGECYRSIEMAGRKPIPTELKILRGNPGRRPLPENEPVPPEGEIRCPRELKGRARRFWKKHEPILKAMGVLTTADVGMLAELCETENEYWTAREDVRERGIEIEVTRYDRKTGAAFYVTEDNPSVRIASDAGKRLKALMAEFGMSPSSRTRVKATPKPAAKSALEELRERRKA